MQFSVGEILSKTFSITLKGFVPFVLISLIVYIPLFLFVAVATQSGSPTLLALTGLLGFVFAFMVAGAITYGVVQELKGGVISLGDCLSVGFQRMLPVIGVSLVVGLCIVAGLILLVIPGLILMVMLYVSVPAAVIEKPGVFGAIDRSMSLTKGHRWSIFGIVLIIGIASAIVNYVVTGGGQSGAVVNPETGMIVMEMPSLGMQLVSMLIGMVLGLFQAVAQAVSYYRLRQVKEGADIEDLAKVFD